MLALLPVLFFKASIFFEPLRGLRSRLVCCLRSLVLETPDDSILVQSVTSFNNNYNSHQSKAHKNLLLRASLLEFAWLSHGLPAGVADLWLGTLLVKVDTIGDYQLCAYSLVVRIAAFQAVDPGSNPGGRINFFALSLLQNTLIYLTDNLLINY